MEPNKKQWNELHSELRVLLNSEGRHAEGIELFLRQHAAVHSARIAQSGKWSFEDEILDDLDDGQYRRIPKGSDHSIAWCIWHIARIEDVTMNMLVSGTSQLMHDAQWRDRMGVSAVDTGNLMTAEEVAALSEEIEIVELRAYRMAVGRRTREIVGELKGDDLIQKVDSDRLKRVMDEGAVVEQARDLIDYWGKRTIAGLLLMPATRHCFVHLNEAARLKRKNK
jgi:hypothetical protein